MYTYGAAERVLAQMYEADPNAQRGALRGRLKHLKRLGIPVGISPGRGAKVQYAREHLYQWAICLEFAECGLDPAVTARFIVKHWRMFRGMLPYIDDETSNGNDVVFTINPAIMSKSWASDLSKDSEFRQDFPDFSDFNWSTLADASLIVERMRGRGRRCIIVNCSAVMRAIDQATAEGVA